MRQRSARVPLLRVPTCWATARISGIRECVNPTSWSTWCNWSPPKGSSHESSGFQIFFVWGIRHMRVELYSRGLSTLNIWVLRSGFGLIQTLVARKSWPFVTRVLRKCWMPRMWRWSRFTRTVLVSVCACLFPHLCCCQSLCASWKYNHKGLPVLLRWWASSVFHRLCQGMEACNVLAHHMCWRQGSWNEGWGHARSAGRRLLVKIVFADKQQWDKGLVNQFFQRSRCEAVRMELPISLVIVSTEQGSAKLN